MRCIEAWISGKVQGVYFRQSTLELGRTLKAKGHVKNLDDGRVYLFTAADDSGQSVLEYVHKGPERSIVESVVSREIEGRIDGNLFVRR